MPRKATNRNQRLARKSLQRLREFYRAAQKGSWDVNTLGWERLSPAPNAEKERWNAVWASVVQQQLQADRFAIKAATDLLLQVEEQEAVLYYSTMVQDEARHVEGWTRLKHMLLPMDDYDPYLGEMGEMLLNADTLEERVIAFQVVFEGMAIYAFKDIASATEQTVLGEMSTRLIRDDSIHHNSGVAYAHYLMNGASDALKSHINDSLKRYVPLYFEHMTWRPKARQWMERYMKDHDRRIIQRNKVLITQSLVDLGLACPFDDL